MDNFTKWLVRGNAVVTVVILLVMLFGGQGSGHVAGSIITANGLQTNAPSSGTSNFNSVEADYGYFDTSSANSNLLGSLTVNGAFTSVASTTSMGGATTTTLRIPLTQATTTVCAIQSPNATSTYLGFSVSFSVSSTTATKIAIATSTSAFATTTFMTGGNLPANGQGAFVGTTSPFIFGVGQGAGLIAPLTWTVVSMTGGAGTFSPVGACTATFGSIN